MLAELSVNEWNGSRKPQLMLQDLAVPEAQLFDLRGTADAVRQAVRLKEVLQPYSGSTPLPPLLFSRTAGCRRSAT